MRASRFGQLSSIGSGPNRRRGIKETRYDRPRILRSFRFSTALLYLRSLPSAGSAQDRVQVDRRFRLVAALMVPGPLGSARDHAGLLDVRSGRLRLRIRARAVRDDAISGALLWIEGFFVPLRGLYLLVAPISALTVILAPFFTGSRSRAKAVGGAAASSERGHPVLPAFLTVAALHALLISIGHHYLHQPSANPARG